MTNLFKNICMSNTITQLRFGGTCPKETPWKRVYLRRFGYDDPFFKRPDTLPRIPEDNKYHKLELRNYPRYKPTNQWSEYRKYFGQNDYIDILGDGSIHPLKLMTNMPPWLRGFRGDEFQMLLLKQIAYRHWRWSKPTKWVWMNKQIMYLWRYLNQKTKTTC